MWLRHELLMLVYLIAAVLLLPDSTMGIICSFISTHYVTHVVCPHLRQQFLYLAYLALSPSLLHRARHFIVPAAIAPVPLRYSLTAVPSRSRFVRPRLALRSVS